MAAVASPALLETVVALAGAGGLGAAGLKLFETLVAKRRSPEQRIGDAAAGASQLIELAMKGAGTSVQQLMAQVEDLNQRMDVLQDSHDACERKNVELSQQVEQLTQLRRQDTQRIDSLLRQLADPAATAPGGSLSGAVIEMAEGTVTVTRPERRTRKRT
jgi:hypothetical protein